MQVFTWHQNTEPRTPSLKSSTELQRWNRSQRRLMSPGHHLPLKLKVKSENFSLRPKRRARSCTADKPSGTHKPPSPLGDLSPAPRGLRRSNGWLGPRRWSQPPPGQVSSNHCSSFLSVNQSSCIFPRPASPPGARGRALTARCRTALSPSLLCRSSLPSH